tara:strand:- start:1387 stop:1686 length:300 start_codon:yes stop_codon:yes gene_type:complete
MTYYNTNHEQGNVLDRSRRKVRNQEEVIFDLFNKYPKEEFTPFEVQLRLNLMCPITSVRRAISNLTKEHKLEKSSKQKLGKYGKLNHTWHLASWLKEDY